LEERIRKEGEEMNEFIKEAQKKLKNSEFVEALMGRGPDDPILMWSRERNSIGRGVQDRFDMGIKKVTVYLVTSQKEYLTLMNSKSPPPKHSIIICNDYRIFKKKPKRRKIK